MFYKRKIALTVNSPLSNRSLTVNNRREGKGRERKGSIRTKTLATKISRSAGVFLFLILFIGNAHAGPKDMFCAATAYDTSGNESVYSNEVSSNFGEGHDATFTWVNPTTNEDGSPYDDKGGTNLYCGTLTGDYNQAWQVTDPNATTATIKVIPTNRPGPPSNYNRVSEIIDHIEQTARGDRLFLSYPNDRHPS